MGVLEIMREVSEETGVCWNDNSMLLILADYIDSEIHEDFETYVRGRAEGENAECEEEDS